MSEDIRKRIDDLLREVDEELDRLTKRMKELIDKGEYRRAYRVWKDESRRFIRYLEDKLEAISDLLEDLDRDVAEKIMRDVRDRVKKMLDKISVLTERIGVKPPRSKPEIRVYVGPLTDMIEDMVESVVDVVETISEEIGDRLERFAEKLGTRQVVSVRIREKDLEVIDELVDAGIFKSRSEAIAFFTRKGIEASKQWINKALEQAKKIKELQESIRKELEELE